MQPTSYARLKELEHMAIAKQATFILCYLEQWQRSLEVVLPSSIPESQYLLEDTLKSMQAVDLRLKQSLPNHQ